MTTRTTSGVKLGAVHEHRSPPPSAGLPEARQPARSAADRKKIRKARRATKKSRRANR